MNCFDLRSNNPRPKDEDLEILFKDKNQVDDKIAWGLGEGFLSFHSCYVWNNHIFTGKFLLNIFMGVYITKISKRMVIADKTMKR